MSLVLSISAAVLLFVTAGYHLTGLQEASAGLVGERRGLVRAAWILVGAYWFITGAIWIAAAFRFLPQATAIWTASIPMLGAIALTAMVGPRFPGVSLLGLAGTLGLISGLIQ
ncbi:hypothetical protein FF80_00877 [Devosia sp. LC5]|nr:hypothetical protein FF80_00877 [Devosia sp. LC5]